MLSDDEVYDPYDLLVQVQNKNDIINKIESIPIVLDKNFLEMKREEKKERPKKLPVGRAKKRKQYYKRYAVIIPEATAAAKKKFKANRQQVK